MNAARLLLVAAMTACVAGCAATSPENQRPQTDALYAPRTAAALAFDPPVALASPAVPLDRDGRAVEAFAGYEQQITTYSYVHQRDEIQHYSRDGQLDRAAYTDRVSVTTR